MDAQAKQVAFNPSDLSDEQLEKIGFALMGFMQRYGVVDKPMTTEQLTQFIECSRDTVNKLRHAGVIKPHFFKGLSTPYYLPSEVIAALKRS